MGQRLVLRVVGQPRVDQSLDDPAPSQGAPDVRATALGVEVPAELSVIGIDDTPLAEVGRPTLTSIQVPMSRAGVMSIDMLHQQLTAEPGQAPAEPRAVTLPTQLVVRQSTGPVAGWTPARRDRSDA